VSFTNPVIPGFHPDPSICRVGDDFYLVTSSFTYFPAVPIFHSRNLVDWTQIGNVLDRASQVDFAGTGFWVSLGIMAPTIRHHDGVFWMITTLVTTTGSRTFFVTATDPCGPWSDPVAVEVEGIDPDLAWDADGACWVHYSSSEGIARCRIDQASGSLIEAPVLTWSGSGLQHPEAPHVFQHSGTWYLILAEGGTERGHAVSIARGPTPAGPWEPNPANPILSHRSTDRPIQNVGHADLVAAADGSWWMVALGVRPRGLTPGFHVLGRETFLAPVHWVDGWPVVDPVRPEMPTMPPGKRDPVLEPARDDFDAPVLHPRWLSLRRPAGSFADLDTRAGRLTIRSGDESLEGARPAFVARRQQHHRCVARTLVDAGDGVEGGLAVYMDEKAHVAVAVRDERVIARARIGSLSGTVGEGSRPAGPVVLVVETAPDYRGPDVVRLGFEDKDGNVVTLAELDGRYLSTEVASGFTGRTIGMYAVGGDAAFDWFEYVGIA
jgi:beta-xylosidase